MAKTKKTKRSPKNIIGRATGLKGEIEALFSSIGEGVIATDAEGRVSLVNQIALDILGFKSTDLMGKWYPAVVIAEDRHGNVLSNMNRPITRAFLSAGPVSARIYLRRKDGKSVPVALNVSPVMLRGKPAGAIEVFRDITEELALDQAKDEFISIASHQLRTPATGVKQYLGMVLSGFAEELKPEQHSLIMRAYDNNERQLRIIEDLLNVARVDAGNVDLNIQNFDLIKLLNESVRDQLFRVKRRRQTFSFTHPQRQLKLPLDPERVRMVMDNLLDNAIKYTPEGKKIELKTYKVGTNAVVQVFDQGVGIAVQDQVKLFQKFQRIPNPLSVEAGGTGLGLYWAQQIIKLHGGRITVDSRLKRGSCFTVYLPLNPAKNRTAK